MGPKSDVVDRGATPATAPGNRATARWELVGLAPFFCRAHTRVASDDPVVIKYEVIVRNPMCA